MNEDLQKEHATGLNMQQLHHLGCGWTDNGWMFLHQGIDTLINFLGIIAHATKLKATNNVQSTACCITTIPTKEKGKCSITTP